MPTINLKQKAASSMIWAALQKYSTMGITFVSGIILARLLTPHDYGCIGMLAIFMTLAESFIDGGFGSALIQKKHPTHEDYSTIFWWNLGMAVLMYLVLFLFAPAIASFYHIPLLCDVLRVQGLVLFIHAFTIVQSNQLKKKLNFRILSIVAIITSFISLSITILLAYNGFGVWSLVAQNLISAFIPALVYWFYIKWRPIWVFSWKSFRQLFGFGFYMFLTHLINNFSFKIHGLLIGKVYNATTMGYYSKALSTESLASSSITSVMTQVSYPLYAEAQDDKLFLRNIIKRLTMTIAYITFPLLFVLVLSAKPLFVLLYSDRWLHSVPYFQVLCFAGMGACLTAVNTQPIAAIGKSKLMFTWTLIKRAIGVFVIVMGMLLFGMKGLLFGVIFNNWLSYFVNIGLTSVYIGYKWSLQLFDLAPIMIVSLIAFAVGYLCGYVLNLGLYLDGVVKVLVFLTIYLSWSFLFKPESYTYVLSIIPYRYRFWEKCGRNKIIE